MVLHGLATDFQSSSGLSSSDFGAAMTSSIRLFCWIRGWVSSSGTGTRRTTTDPQRVSKRGDGVSSRQRRRRHTIGQRNRALVATSPLNWLHGTRIEFVRAHRARPAAANLAD